MFVMLKNEIIRLPEYFERYIAKVPDIPLLDALTEFGHPYLDAQYENFKSLGHSGYAPGKWTIHDILQHIIDTERIFAYRALRFARNDKTVLSGFDENAYAENAHAGDRNMEDLMEEFRVVRQGTIVLFQSFNSEDLMREGFSFKSDISVLAIGFTLAGHVIHHMDVIRDRYFPLLNQS